MSSLRVFISESHEPWFNIAVEETIFRHLSPQKKVLYLWRNADTIVIGRAQNPWKECNTRKMEEDGVKLARRSSGGGAVFHDLGNLCFTFMSAKTHYDKHKSTQIIVDALSTLGVQSRSSGRNDLVVTIDGSDKKISGSAYRETLDRGLHHGTLLLHTDLARLSNYLHPDPKKLQSKGITSVRSRVTNLNQIIADIQNQQVCDAIIQAFFAHYQDSAEIEYISPEKMPDLPGLYQQWQHQSSWEWNYGKSPEFNHYMDERFDWGGVEVHLDVKMAMIQQAKIYTDSLNPSPLEELAELLIGCHYKSDAVAQLCQQMIERYPEQKSSLTEFHQWLQANIS